MKRIGIYGAWGFLGSHVVEALRAGDDLVLAHDDRSSCWIDGDGDPRFCDPALDVDYDSLFGSDVLINLALPHPPPADLAEYRRAYSGYVSGFLDLVFDGVASRTLKRVVVAAGYEALSVGGRSRAGSAHLVRALREALRYVHRPPRIDVEFVYLPELFGPRQLPANGRVAAMANGAAMTYLEPFCDLLPVDVAAAFVANRALEEVHRKSVDVVVRGTPVTANDLLAAVSRTRYAKFGDVFAENLGDYDASVYLEGDVLGERAFPGIYHSKPTFDLVTYLESTLAWYEAEGEKERNE